MVRLDKTPRPLSIGAEASHSDAIGDSESVATNSLGGAGVGNDAGRKVHQLFIAEDQLRDRDHASSAIVNLPSALPWTAQS
ncbi:hypothetical protein BVI1335_1250006 [Burkholderia vietnamiensis]|nr:hypothetical protein BVI1335_1250006 [Burkholderia vietnamiensis]